MIAEMEYIELSDYEPLPTRAEERFIPLLVDLLNMAIEERNRCYDGVVNQRSNKIENEEDKEWVLDMDKVIYDTIEELNDEYL